MIPCNLRASIHTILVHYIYLVISCLYFFPTLRSQAKAMSLLKEDLDTLVQLAAAVTNDVPSWFSRIANPAKSVF